jgi:protein-tyrosine phosphatase
VERRHFVWEGCLNARDLGGLPTIDHRHTRYGVFVRGDSTCELTQRGQAELIADGVKTIVDIRGHVELDAQPNPFADARDITYLHRPFNDAALEARLQEIASPPERYVTMIDASGARIAAIADALVTARPAVLFHCLGGRDRTGILAALVLSVAGVPNTEIEDDFVLSDERMVSRYARWREALTPAQIERADRARTEARDSIRAALRRVQSAWGGAHKYLLAHGIEKGRLDELRRAFVG